MNIYITLDYEIFFGSKSGDVKNCIIDPTNELLSIVDPFNIKIVFFVDVGFLIKLHDNKEMHQKLRSDYALITNQIKYLSENGHAIGLHIHPHWENSVYDGNEWIFDLSQYKLSDCSKKEAYNIIIKYNTFLENLINKKPVAYRAGGWSAQPFSYLKKGLSDAGIFIDSTVYPKGYHNSSCQNYDFKNVPQYKTVYRFDNDLTVENIKGRFIEYPISSIKVSPLFFWKFAFKKLFRSANFKAFGNGRAISKPKKVVLKLLTKSSYSVVSIDGYKASFLSKAFKKYLKNVDNNGCFVIIGHPKAFTPYSLKKTNTFIKKYRTKHNFTVFK